MRKENAPIKPKVNLEKLRKNVPGAQRAGQNGLAAEFFGLRFISIWDDLKWTKETSPVRTTSREEYSKLIAMC